MYQKLYMSTLLLTFGIAHCTCIEIEQPQEPKTVFLTGAAGFIGSNFLRYMYDKYPEYSFIVLDALTYAGNPENIPDYIKNSARFEFICDTVTNQETVDDCMARSDFVVHFAAETHVTRSLSNPRTFIDTDIVGTLTLLYSLVKHKNVQRFVHISTSEVYGTTQSDPIDEDRILKPHSPYAAAKAGADRLVYAYCCTYDVPAVIIRPFNNYGPNQHIEKLIPRFVTRAIKGLPLPVHGDGSAKRDWLHVMDTCEALDRVLHIKNFDSIKHQVINLGSSIPYSVYDIVQMISNEFGLTDRSILYQEDRPGQVACQIASTEKAERLLGWKAKRTFKESLKDVIAWYKQHESWWKRLEMMELAPVKLGNKTIKQ